MTEALEEEREFLLRSIADLDAEHAAGDIADDDYRTLRDGYTTRAAAVLRNLGANSAEYGTIRAQNPTRGRGLVALVGLAVVLVAAGTAWVVASLSGERVRGAPAAGSIPQASTDRIAQAQQLVADGDVLEAIKTYDSLLDDDPENPVALAERGWLLSRVDPSLSERGLQSIDKAIAVDPGYPEAHFYRGMILLETGSDPAAAAASFDAAIAAGPPPDLLKLFEEARDRAREQAGAGAGGGSSGP